MNSLNSVLHAPDDTSSLIRVTLLSCQQFYTENELISHQIAMRIHIALAEFLLGVAPVVGHKAIYLMVSVE